MRYILEGSVRRAGQRVRITGQLIEADTGNHLCAERFDRDLADIFAIQDEITQSVVGAIEPEMLLIEGKRALRKHGLLPDWPRFLHDFQHHWPTDVSSATCRRLTMVRLKAPPLKAST